MSQTIEAEIKMGWNYALKVLSRRALFCSQLREKLEKRFLSEEAIDAVLEKVKRYGFVNDEELLRASVTSAFTRGRGPKRVLYDLMRKSKLPKEMINKEIVKQMPFDLCVDKARKLAKRYKMPEQKKRAIAFLLRRGFSYDVVQKVLNFDE